jgi:hypothetical protein
MLGANPLGRRHAILAAGRRPAKTRVVRVGDNLQTWTYGSSQKIANLRRLAEATVLIEDGDSYETLRGVSMETDVEIIEDTQVVTGIGITLTQRYAGAKPGDPVPDELAAFIGKQASKRVGLIFTPTKTVSWDHGNSAAPTNRTYQSVRATRK